MAFKARCTRSDKGTYVLTYGKGGKQLAAMLDKIENGDWVITHHGGKEFDRSDRKREVVAAWEQWAASAYGTSRADPATTSRGPADPPNADVVPDLTDEKIVTQLVNFYQIADPGQIQTSIRDAPTREDQIRRWYTAWRVTGQEFRLPETCRPTLPPPPVFKPKVNSDQSTTQASSETEAPAAHASSQEDVAESPVSGEQGPDSAD